MNNLAKTLSLTALLTSSFALALPTYAADGYTLVLQQTELTTTSGLQQVHLRMLQAAKDYCPTYRQIRSWTDVDTCVASVVQDLTDKIADERLSNYVAAMDRPRSVRKLALQVAH